jgi:hypothetical protein
MGVLMADTIKLPLVGETSKGTVFIAGLAGVAALGWAWYKKKETAKSSAATAAASTATTATPTAGYGYGAYSYQPYGYGFGSSGLGEYGGGTGDYGYGYYGAGEPTEEVPTQATTNQQWVEAAMGVLSGAGYTEATSLPALGLYITGSPLSSAQVAIVQAAIAAEGYPPQPGASGNPPGLNTSGTTGGQTGTTSAGNVSVPNVANMTADNALGVLKSAGLNGTITLDPTSDKKGIYHIVTKTQPAAGTSVAKGTTVVIYYRDSSSS